MHVSPLVAHLSISLCCMSVACAFLFCTSSLFLTVYVGCATEAGMEGVHLSARLLHGPVGSGGERVKALPS